MRAALLDKPGPALALNATAVHQVLKTQTIDSTSSLKY